MTDSSAEIVNARMARQAIVTKYLGPTNTRGGRIKATARANSVTIPYPHEVRGGTEGAHSVAALALCAKLEWAGKLVCGGTPDDSGYVFVFVE